MLSVYCRSIIKIFLFISSLLFILFFVVYWFRYHENVWFIQKNVFIKIDLWSNDNSIKVNGTKYYPQDKKITLFNMDEWCYSIETNKKNKRCLSKNQSFEDVFVENKWKKEVKNIHKETCYSVKNLFFQKNCIKNKCFSQKINNVFRFNNINFIHFDKNLIYCNKDFEICHNLWKIQWDITCANSKGLYFYNSWFKLLKLK